MDKLSITSFAFEVLVAVMDEAIFDNLIRITAWASESSVEHDLSRVVHLYYPYLFGTTPFIIQIFGQLMQVLFPTIVIEQSTKRVAKPARLNASIILCVKGFPV